MNTGNEHQSNKSIPVGDNSPSIETVDVHDKLVNFSNLLETHDGILIDFYRGMW
jgi:hypothetical protein